MQTGCEMLVLLVLRDIAAGLIGAEGVRYHQQLQASAEDGTYSRYCDSVRLCLDHKDGPHPLEAAPPHRFSSVIAASSYQSEIAARTSWDCAWQTVCFSDALLRFFVIQSFRATSFRATTPEFAHHQGPLIFGCWLG